MFSFHLRKALGTQLGKHTDSKGKHYIYIEHLLLIEILASPFHLKTKENPKQNDKRTNPLKTNS